MPGVRNVLFVCTANSARSVLAEAILNDRGKGRFRAYSAGSHPRGQINPYARELLKRLGYDTSDLRSKGWDEFAPDTAPKMDFVFTVCDSAKNETCPLCPGHPTTAHWGIPDPAAVHGSEAEIRQAFEVAYRRLEHRIDDFLALPFDALDEGSLRERLEAIGTAAGPKASAAT